MTAEEANWQPPPQRWLERLPLPIPHLGSFERESPPFRPERLVLASAFVAELEAEGLQVDGVHQLPSGNYAIDLVPKDPEDDE